MYAVIKDSIVIWYFVGTLENAKKEYPNCEFILMTQDIGMIAVGYKWDGKQFTKGDTNG
jgi:hypothetical protein